MVAKKKKKKSKKEKMFPLLGVLSNNEKKKSVKSKIPESVIFFLKNRAFAYCLYENFFFPNDYGSVHRKSYEN